MLHDNIFIHCAFTQAELSEEYEFKSCLYVIHYKSRHYIISSIPLSISLRAIILLSTLSQVLFINVFPSEAAQVSHTY
jgi:hypothetical protein